MVEIHAAIKFFIACHCILLFQRIPNRFLCSFFFPFGENIGDYVSFIGPLTGGMGTEINKNLLGNENGFLKDNVDSQDTAKKEN